MKLHKITAPECRHFNPELCNKQRTDNVQNSNETFENVFSPIDQFTPSST